MNNQRKPGGGKDCDRRQDCGSVAVVGKKEIEGTKGEQWFEREIKEKTKVQHDSRIKTKVRGEGGGRRIGQDSGEEDRLINS